MTPSADLIRAGGYDLANLGAANTPMRASNSPSTMRSRLPRIDRLPTKRLSRLPHNSKMTSYLPFGHELRGGISQIVRRVFPKSGVRSVSVLEGGKTNSNLLIRIENCKDLFVLRRYRRGPSACRKEVSLLQALQDVFPVPRLIDADTTGDVSGTAYSLYRYVAGQTFREIRQSGTLHDMAGAAAAIAHCLSVLGSLEGALLLSECFLPRFDTGKEVLDSPVLRERLGLDELLRLQELHAKWSTVLHSLPGSVSLMHGDFNHRNIVVTKATGTWEVAGVLDWELASKGSFLWDAARFMCYETLDSRWWEDAFAASLGASSKCLPDNWADLSRVLNTLSAARSLASRDLQERFTDGLKLLVCNGLHGKRIG